MVTEKHIGFRQNLDKAIRAEPPTKDGVIKTVSKQLYGTSNDKRIVPEATFKKCRADEIDMMEIEEALYLSLPDEVIERLLKEGKIDDLIKIVESVFVKS